jgi:hypothetical protein
MAGGGSSSRTPLTMREYETESFDDEGTTKATEEREKFLEENTGQRRR